MSKIRLNLLCNIKKQIQRFSLANSLLNKQNMSKLSNQNKASAQRTKISVRKERLVSAKKPKDR